MIILKAVIYARYSSDLQREESIEAQVRACKEYINNNNYVLTNTYIDRAFSARSDHRPEFQKMITDAKFHRFDAVVIHKLDRFSRDRYDHAFYKRELRQSGVKLISVLERLDGSPESVMMEAMLEGFSEYYSKNLAREVMKGLKENALQCKHTGGTPPIGYDVDSNGKYIINEKEAEAVRYIFKSYLNDTGYDSIFRWLRNNGFRNKRGTIIKKNSLHDILNNEKYTGTFIYNRSTAKDAFGKRNGHANKPDSEIIRIEGGMPAIISKDIFKRVKAKMKGNKSGKHRAKEPYLLSGLIFCGNCGGAMVGCSRGRPRTATEITKKYYECNYKKRTRTCDMKAVNRDEIEDAVISYLEDLVTKQSINEITEWFTHNAKIYMKSAQLELKKVKNELAAVSRNVENLLDKILDGLDSKAARERLKELEAKKLQLEIKVTDMEISAEAIAPVTKRDVKKYLSQLQGLRNKSREEQKQIIKQFVNRVIVYAPTDDGSRKFKIKTNLDSLFFSREDAKGGSPSPPKTLKKLVI